MRLKHLIMIDIEKFAAELGLKDFSFRLDQLLEKDIPDLKIIRHDLANKVTLKRLEKFEGDENECTEKND